MEEAAVPADGEHGPARLGGRRPTMKDVAALAGVGLKTVSRVVNDEPGVSAQTAERVRRAARRLHYRVDLTAGTLRRADRVSGILGLLLGSVGNPFDASIHRAVENAAGRRGAIVLSASTDERPERERELASALLGRRVDGLIIAPTGCDQRYLQPEISRGTPLVMVDRRPVGVAADAVLSDNAEGARSGMEHLLSHGHRRVAVLGHYSRLYTARERLAGARTAMAAAGVESPAELVAQDLDSEADAMRAMSALLDLPDPPTAVFCTRNIVTCGAFGALRARGLEHRIALAGFDDFTHAQLLDPAVTVVAQDVEALGEKAVDRLYERLIRPELPARALVLATRLVIRHSCGCR